MKRKSLLLGLAALALAMTFVGCESPVNPDNITTTEAIPSVGDPTNVQAKVYPGAIVLSWDLVKDAKGYEVYRRDNTTQAIAVLQEVDSDTEDVPVPYYADIISKNNPLVDGRSYTYVILALSGQSTSSRALLGNDGDIVWNGQSSVTVSAKLPADNPTPSITDLTAVQVKSGFSFSSEDNTNTFTSDESESVKVGWKALEYNPAVKVGIVYAYGKTPVDTVEITRWVSSDVSSTLIPLIGGPNTISVQAIFGDGTFYTNPTPAKITSNFVQDILDVPSTFTITRSGSGASLSWDEVKTATSYEVYRVEITGNPDNSNADFISDGNVTVVGDWTKVSVTKAELIIDTQNGNSWKATDPAVPANKEYLYAIVAVNGTAKSTAKTAFIGSGEAEEPEEWDITILDNNQVLIAFAPEQGATYALSRAKVTFADDEASIGEATTPLTIESYTLLTAKSNKPSWITYIDTTLETRSYYRYKLDVTKNGATASYYKNLTDAPFKDSVDVGITAATSTTTDGAIDLTFTDLDFTAGKDDDLKLFVYRAEAEQVSGDYVEKSAFTLITTAGISSLNYEDTDTSLDSTKTYLYRFEVRKGTTVLKNKPTESNVAVANATPKA